MSNSSTEKLSKHIFPLVGVDSLKSKLISVLLPAPFLPQIAIRSPLFMEKDIPDKIFFLLFENETSEKEITEGTKLSFSFLVSHVYSSSNAIKLSSLSKDGAILANSFLNTKLVQLELKLIQYSKEMPSVLLR